MKATVLYDRDGTVHAAAVYEGDYDGPRPVPRENTSVDEFEVPVDYQDRPLPELFAALRVDVEARELVARDRSAD